PEQAEDYPRPGIGSGQRGTQPARSAGNNYDAKRRTHPRALSSRRPEIVTAGAEHSRHPKRKLGTAPGDGALQAARSDNPAGAPQLGDRQPLDDDLGPARK